MGQLYIDWEITDHTGWGVYAFNLVYWGLLHPRFKPVPMVLPPRLLHTVDPLTLLLIRQQKDSWNSGVGPMPGDAMLRAVGNEINEERFTAPVPQAGVIFFESNPLPEETVQRLRRFDAIIAGSRWNQRLLLERGIDCRCVLQGVDTDLFRPQPKRLYKDRFVVFSGGKLEYRKGQDLILRAFSIFARRHTDALLMTAWRSPWESALTPSVNASGLCEPIVPGRDMQRSIVDWALANGIRPQQFLELGSISNRLMPEVLREVDLAMFPNRCEGGTNLVAMEALSCGLNCAISSNTGHLDIIGQGNCVPLSRQRPIPSADSARRQDWGESDIEEMLEILERGYAGGLGLDVQAVRKSVAGLSWESSINALWSEVETLIAK